MEKRYIAASVILSLGIALAGIAVAFAVKLAKDSERFVTVKGLSERPVKANQGTWSIRYSSGAETLEGAISQNKIDRQHVLQFIQDAGFGNDEIRPGTPSVVEQANYNMGKSRHNVNEAVVIISNKVDKIAEIARNSSKLLNNGVALTGWENPTYYFTLLGDIKPTMIEEATKDARKAAEKFAQDAGSKVGAIRRASQGYFAFNGENSGISESEQISKIARVVVTVDYLIAD